MVGDRIGDLFAYLCLIITFLISVFIFIWQFDRVKDDLVRDYTLEFVNDCQTTGVISPQNYYMYTQKIGSLGHYYVELSYESLRSYPKEDASGNVTGFFRDYYTYNNQDILDAMYPSSGDVDFEMKTGDKIVASVRTMGNQSSHWLGMLFGDNNSKHLVTRRSGTIGNNKMGD